MHTRHSLLLFVLLISTLPLWAKGEVTSSRSLKEVIVTHPVVTTAAVPIQVIEASAAIDKGLHGVGEALDALAGVSLKDYGGLGGVKTVSLRSLGANYTAITYDGVTLSNTYMGSIDLSRFSLDNLESITVEMLQGGDLLRSAREQSGGGNVRLHTIIPKTSQFALKARLEGGSFGLIRPSLQLSKALSSTLSLSLYSSYTSIQSQYPFTYRNGNEVVTSRRQNADLSNTANELNLRFNRGSHTFLTKLYYQGSERGLPGSVIFYTEGNNERTWDNNAFVQLSYTYQPTTPWQVMAHAKYDYLRTRYHDTAPSLPNGEVDNLYRQQEYYLTGCVTYTPLEGLHVAFANDVAVNTFVTNFPSPPNPLRTSLLQTLSAAWKSDRIQATASLLHTSVWDLIRRDGTKTHYFRFSPAASLSVRPWEESALRIRLAFKDIYRLPTFADLYTDRVSSYNLLPERAQQYNLGLTWWGDPSGWCRQLSLSLDGYYNRIHDKIVALPRNLFFWSMLNMGEVEIFGLDATAKCKIPIAEGFFAELEGSYTFQHAIDITNPQAKTYRHDLPYTPRHSGSISLHLHSPWVDATYKLDVLSGRYALPQNIPTNYLSGYFLHSFTLYRTFTVVKTRLRLQAEWHNIANTPYEVIRYYPMPQTRFNVSLSLIL